MIASIFLPRTSVHGGVGWEDRQQTDLPRCIQGIDDEKRRRKKEEKKKEKKKKRKEKKDQRKNE